MANVIKLAQSGYDVNTAGDENLIYSSQWPVLKIYKTGTYTITDFDNDQIITDHDLGYTPLFWYTSSENIESYKQPAGTLYTAARSDFFGYLNNGFLSINSKNLKFEPSGVFGSTGEVKLQYYIFTLPLLEDYEAPQINVGGLQTGSGDKVFKIAKPGKSINSSKLEDYVIHSDARTPLVHRVKSGVLKDSGGAYPSFVVNHGLGYEPMFSGFVNNGVNDYYYNINTIGSVGGAFGFFSDNQTVRYSYPAFLNTAIVVFKDPFLIDYTVNITV